MLPVVYVSLPFISVIVPTIDGREEHLERCLRAYAEHSEGSYKLDLVLAVNEPTCGWGWQKGCEKAKGDYLHFTDDDIEPHAGWAEPAIECVQRGFIPAPQVFGPQGDPQSHPHWGFHLTDWEPVFMTSLPFVSREQFAAIAPLFTAHYSTDNWFSWRAHRAGWPTRVRTGYAFTHWWAEHGRGAGLEEYHRLTYDGVLFAEAQRKVIQGEWTEPWPPPDIARPAL